MNHIAAFTRNWRRRSEMWTIMAAMAGSRRCSASLVSLEGERSRALFRFGSGSVLEESLELRIRRIPNMSSSNSFDLLLWMDALGFQPVSHDVLRGSGLLHLF